MLFLRHYEGPNLIYLFSHCHILLFGDCSVEVLGEIQRAHCLSPAFHPTAKRGKSMDQERSNPWTLGF